MWSRPLQLVRRGATGEAQSDRRPHHRPSASGHHALLLPTLLLIVSPIPAAAATGSAAGMTAPAVRPVPSPEARPMPAGAPIALRLDDAVALALRDNRTIRSAYLDRISQKFTLYVAERGFIPQGDVATDLFLARTSGISDSAVTLSPNLRWRTPTGAAIGFNWDRNYQARQGTQTYYDRASLTVEQPLLRGGGLAVNRAPIRIARLQDQVNRLRLRATVSATVSTVILAYRTLLQAQEQTRLADAALGRTRQLLDTNRALIEAGRMAAADIVQARSQVAAQEVGVLQAAQQLRSAQLALLKLLAVDLRTNVVAADPIAARHVDVDTERVVTNGLAARMDVLGQRLTVEQARQTLLIARNDRLWDLSVVGALAKARNLGPLEGAVDPRVDRSVRLRLGIPIGQPQRRQGEIDATIGLRQAELGYEDLVQSAESDIRDALQTVEAAWQQSEAARQARDLAQQVLDIGRERLRVGRASNFEILSFETDLRTADTQQLAAAIAYLNALTALDELTGNTLDTWQITLND